MDHTIFRRRLTIALCVALGLGGVSIALGMIYLDYVKREGAWVEAGMRGHDLTTDEQDTLLKVWTDKNSFVPALIGGTLGVVLLGLGGTLALFELRVFNRGQA